MKIQQLFFIALLKSIWFNFRYLPLAQAVKMPIILARNVRVKCCYRGFCVFEGGVKTGILKIGFLDREYHGDAKSLIKIKGKLVVKGSGFHSFGVGTVLGIGGDAVLTVGNNFSSSARNNISCHCGITIGDDNMWSFDNVIMDSDTHQICDEYGEIINYNKPIVFGNHVWLGCRNIVMKGSEIPDGCTVASGSKISSKFTEPNCIITSGKKIIKQNIHWKRDWAKNKNI